MRRAVQTKPSAPTVESLIVNKPLSYGGRQVFIHPFQRKFPHLR
jgi:hypothetical protein